MWSAGLRCEAAHGRREGRGWMLEIVNDTGRWQSDAHAGPLGWILLNKMLTAAIRMNFEEGTDLCVHS